MDLLQSPKDATQVETLVKNVVRNPANPLVSNDNRVHFVSARSALEATLTQTPNEHSKPFSEFISALETFLVEERGELTLKKGIADIREFVSGVQDSLNQTTDTLEGKLKISAAEHHRILEKTGDISGFDVNIQKLRGLLIKEAVSEIRDSWDQWLSGLDTRLANKSNRWMTIRDQKENIYREYVNHFTEDIFETLDIWIEESVVKTIIKPRIERLDIESFGKLEVIRQDLKSIDDNAGTILHKQFELSRIGSDLEFHSNFKLDTEMKATGFLKGFGLIIGKLALAPLFPVFLAGDLMGLMGDQGYFILF